MSLACVSMWGDSRKFFGAFMETAKRNGLNPINADPNNWPGTSWENIEWFRKSEAQAKFVRENQGTYTHFMFTDSYDIVFAAGAGEILEKFEALESPIVFAAECCPWPKKEQAPLYPSTNRRCKYLNAGFWMATAEAALPFVADLASIAVKREQCDQGIVVDMFLSGRHPIKLDTSCSIAFCCNLDSLDFLDLSGKRPKTTDAKQEPCLFHGNGNSPLGTVIACLDKGLGL